MVEDKDAAQIRDMYSYMSTERAVEMETLLRSENFMVGLISYLTGSDDMLDLTGATGASQSPSNPQEWKVENLISQLAAHLAVVMAGEAPEIAVNAIQINGEQFLEVQGPALDRRILAKRREIIQGGKKHRITEQFRAEIF